MLTLDVRLQPGPVSDDVAAVAVLARPGDGGPALVAPADGAALGAAPVDLPEHLRREKVKAEPGEVVAVPTFRDAGPRVVLVAGVGDELRPETARKAGAALVRRARDHERLALLLPAAVDAVALRALAEGLLLASYRFTLKSDGKPPALRDVVLVGPSDEGAAAAVARARAVASAVAWARDLANAPSSDKSPQSLAADAERIAGETGLAVTVRDERALVAEGFHGIAAVGQGSARPPRLIELRYTPDDAAADARHVVLVGKGITFDSGGLSIKPADGMPLMKTDMSGGAAVLATMSALRAVGCQHRVTGLVAAAENMPSGSALRPGDVIRHYGGRTSEVLNTDAEGRLVLADALAYADAVLAPDAVVDLATLTGAATLGLGKRHAAFYATDEPLAAELLAAATAAGERWWRMPLVDDYRATLDSPVADLSNIGTDATIGGGSIVAALFLREFAGPRAWAHLDMAGPARADKDEDEVTKGATGYAVRTLLRWLEAPPAA